MTELPIGITLQTSLKKLPALFLIFIGALLGQGTEPITAFINVSVIPMDVERIVANQTVLIRGNRIEAVGPSASIEIPDGTLEIDGTGKYLMPGLADMLIIPFSIDSAQISSVIELVVLDNREVAGPFLGIRQVKKWRYVPVDQYLVLEIPLTQVFGRGTRTDTQPLFATLAIENLSIWHDPSLFCSSAWTLNARSLLLDSLGTPVRQWQWEYPTVQPVADTFLPYYPILAHIRICLAA